MRKIYYKIVCQVASFLILLTTYNSFAQSWVTAGNPFYTNDIHFLFNDTTHNELYFSGNIPNPGWGNIPILKYDGQTWTILGTANTTYVLSMAKFNNELVVGGFFANIDGVSVNNIAKFNGISWQPFGNFNQAVYRVKVINGELFAMGGFTMVDGIFANGIAKWNGNNWENVNNFPFSEGYVKDAEYFQGNLYVGGQGFFFANGTDYNDIAVLKNGAWQQVGSGIQGTFSGIDKMIVYKNELYVADLIWRKHGNCGDGIQKWNGIEWSDLGEGLKTDLNPSLSQSHAYDLKIYNNDLYVSGLFKYANDLDATGLAKWDGEQWCSYPTQDFLGFGVLEIYNDTIFLDSGIDSLNGAPVHGLIKLLDFQPLECSVLGLEKPTDGLLQLAFSPNPCTTTLTVSSNETPFQFNFYNLHGQEVISGTSTEKQLDVTALKPGMYFLKVKDRNSTRTGKVVKVEP